MKIWQLSPGRSASCMQLHEAGGISDAMRIRTIFPPDMIRFAVVIAGGLVVDLFVAFLVATWAGLPLVFCAAAGFFAGAGFNYVLHELWTFGIPSKRMSLTRASLYLATSLATLGVRLVLVALLAPFAIGEFSRLGVLVAAAGVSFIANYLLSRFAVYRRSSQRDPGALS